MQIRIHLDRGCGLRLYPQRQALSSHYPSGATRSVLLLSTRTWRVHLHDCLFKVVAILPLRSAIRHLIYRRPYAGRTRSLSLYVRLLVNIICLASFRRLCYLAATVLSHFHTTPDATFALSYLKTLFPAWKQIDCMLRCVRPSASLVFDQQNTQHLNVVRLRLLDCLSRLLTCVTAIFGSLSGYLFSHNRPKPSQTA